MKRLGVNIDHVATLRNARKSFHPDPIVAAKKVLAFGADSVTIHLREDRRHINDKDLHKIANNKKIPLNLEIAVNIKMVKIALKNKPNFICLVPEKRKEITTEGGLNLKKNKFRIKKIISILKRNNIRTSLFINPNIQDIKLSKILNTDCVELHTGKVSELIKSNKKFNKELDKIKKCSKLGYQLGIEIHAGHGIDYKTAKILNKIKYIKEFNIGHFIIGEAIIYGFKKVIKKFKKNMK